MAKHLSECSWQCISHRHNCPLAMLLHQTVALTSDLCLRQLSAASLLSYSIQTECQTQLDLIGALPLLLRILHNARDDGDVRMFVAATLWNLTKSPLLLLKLETVHGILKEQLMRKLTDVLWTPLESFQLSVTPTGERGTSGLLESDSADNLGVMLAASVSTRLSVVLRIENYVGRPRTLMDQFRAKTPIVGVGRHHDASAIVEGCSVSHFDESGVLRSRTCAVCSKPIKLRKRRKPSADETGVRDVPYLACTRDDCEQTFHTTCSRWKKLPAERRVEHAHEFHCAKCMLQDGRVSYCDFVADDAAHEALLTEARFKSVGIQRAPSPSGDAGVSYSALLDKGTKDVVAVGVKKFRIPSSSQDMEMFVVSIRYVRLSACPATQQTSGAQRNRSPSPLPSSPSPSPPEIAWSVSYARDGSLQVPVAPGSAVFWPGPFLQDIEVSLYTQRSLADLEAVFLYEFQGKTSTDMTYSFGRPVSDRSSATVSSSTSAVAETPALWTTLHPRRGVCMKLLAEQIGHHKKLNELLGSGNGRAPSNANANSKKPKRKPHLIGRKLNRVAVALAT
jgi:hypothetical protein